MTLLLKAYRLLDRTERRRAFQMLAIVVTVALFETLGTVSVMPFLAVMADPKLIEENGFLSSVYGFFGFDSPRRFLFFLGFASFALLILSAVMRTVGRFVVIRFNQSRTYSISRRLLESYLRRPYAFYLQRHTGDLSRSLLSEVGILTAQIYAPLTSLVTQSVLLLALIGLLVAVNPLVAAIGLGVLGGSYGLIYLFVRHRLADMAEQRILANKARFRLIGEALGGIKAVKLMGKERDYLGRFSSAAQRMAQLQAATQTLSMIPRYSIEAVAFGGIILLALILMVQHGDDPDGAVSKVLPLLGVYAFAGYRLMPAVQGIYGAFTQLRFGAPVLDTISAELDEARAFPELPASEAEELKPQHAIELDSVSFRHEGAEQASLREITLTIPVGSTLGIVGATGAGKTTLVDVFLGLLTPESGEIRVDGQPVTAENLRSWQAALGYVPQDIFLLDASVTENIAFAVPAEKIDHDRVRDCARMAQISDFVETELPEGFETRIGERGVRLSGGQRQRIGIARALYRNPGILVFDEATSALDNFTERALVEAIDALAGQKTILLIAHRISTVMNCDQIVVLDHGRVVGLGTYRTLYDTNPAFRQLVDAREVA